MILTFLRIQSFGVLEGDDVVWNNEKLSFDATNFKFFFGLPEVGKNLLWRPMDAHPTLFLNFYHKVKGFLKPQNVLTRS